MPERDRRGVRLPDAAIEVPPGGLAMASRGTTLAAVVASGVAVCLWAPQEGRACLAHFLEPRTGDPAAARARFGNVALHRGLELLEAPSGGCEAQIIGGARAPSGFPDRGPENVEFARGFLARRGIPLVSEDVGGDKGRKIVFDPGTGHVAVVKVHRLRREDWNG